MASDLFHQLQNAVGDTYRLERELGGGGMSRVFLAEETALKRKVVIKVLPPEMAAGVNKERFQRETQLAASLQHPLIVPILTAGVAEGEDSDILYYVMPFIDGQSLGDKIEREGELPINDAVRIFRDVAEALARAHESNVVHRDIKPDNVMLSGNHAMVTDFGIAKAVSASHDETQGGLTQFGMALGTPRYMAPEQAAGDPQVDHRADLYSLGVMAYEVLTGRLPFEATTPQAMLAAHVSATPDPIAMHRSSVPIGLADVVMRCLEKRPADRWQSAAELAAAFDGMTGSTSAVMAGTTGAFNVEAFVHGSHPLKVAGVFALGGAAFVAVAYLVMMQFGLPDWTLSGSIVLAVLAVLMATGTAWSTGRGPSKLTWRRTRTVLGGAFGVFAAALIGYSAMRALGIGPMGTLVASGLLNEQDRIVLAQFDNGTNDSTLAETVTELLRIDLAQSPTVTLLEGQQITSALRRMERDPSSVVTFELASEIAEREGAKAVVGGEIRSLGADYVVSVRLVAASTGETLAAARETAKGGAIVEAVDRLSASLRSKIGESLKSIRGDAPLDQVTTASTEALRTYARALRVNDQGQPDRAITLLEQAISEDSTFAMAYRKLAVLLSNQKQEPERADSAFTIAYELRDRLTERERYLAEAAYYTYVDQDLDAARDAYTSLLDNYPSDPTALNNLALNYRSAGRVVEAEELYRRSINFGSATPTTFGNAIPVQYDLGMVDTASASLDRLESQYPGHPQGIGFRAAFESARFRYDEAEQSLQDLRNAQLGNPAIQFQVLAQLANINFVRGRIDEGKRSLWEALDVQEEAGFAFIPQPRPLFEAMVEGIIDLWYREDPTAAVTRLDRARQQIGYDTLPPEQRDLIQIADLYARAGRPDRARELIADYEATLEPDATQDDRSAQLWGAYGTVAFAEERYDEALRAFQSARETSPGCPVCWFLEVGQTFDRLGLPDSAIAALESYLETPMLYRVQQDAFNLGAVLSSLGQLYEQTGQTDRAIETYDRLLTLWENAGENLQPRVSDLRGRVARLVSEKG